MSLEQELTQIEKGNVAPLYLIHGNEKFLIERVRQVFLDSVLTPEEKQFNFGKFDMETTPIDRAVEEALSAPFFGEKRLVFVENSFFLTAERTKAEIEHDLKWLEEYVERPSPDSVMVLFAPYEKLDQRKKIVKTLKKNAKVLSTMALSEKETRNYVEEILQRESYHMTPEAINLLLQLTGSHLSTTLKELKKLMLYAHDEKHITPEIVQELTVKGLEENVFELMDLILQKKTAASLMLFQSLLNQKEEPIKIIALLLSQFRLLLQVKILRGKGYQQGEITKFLKVHPYRVKLAVRQEKKFTYQALSRAFSKLIDADFQLKTGEGKPQTTFELFVLSFTEENKQPVSFK